MGRLVTGAHNPVVLYVSGGNTQVYTVISHSVYAYHRLLAPHLFPYFPVSSLLKMLNLETLLLLLKIQTFIIVYNVVFILAK